MNCHPEATTNTFGLTDAAYRLLAPPSPPSRCSLLWMRFHNCRLFRVVHTPENWRLCGARFLQNAPTPVLFFPRSVRLPLTLNGLIEALCQPSAGLWADVVRPPTPPLPPTPPPPSTLPRHVMPARHNRPQSVLLWVCPPPTPRCPGRSFPAFPIRTRLSTLESRPRQGIAKPSTGLNGEVWTFKPRAGPSSKRNISGPRGSTLQLLIKINSRCTREGWATLSSCNFVSPFFLLKSGLRASTVRPWSSTGSTPTKLECIEVSKAGSYALPAPPSPISPHHTPHHLPGSNLPPHHHTTNPTSRPHSPPTPHHPPRPAVPPQTPPTHPRHHPLAPTPPPLRPRPPPPPTPHSSPPPPPPPPPTLPHPPSRGPPHPPPPLTTTTTPPSARTTSPLPRTHDSLPRVNTPRRPPPPHPQRPPSPHHPHPPPPPRAPPPKTPHPHCPLSRPPTPPPPTLRPRQNYMAQIPNKHTPPKHTHTQSGPDPLPSPLAPGLCKRGIHSQQALSQPNQVSRTATARS